MTVAHARPLAKVRVPLLGVRVTPVTANELVELLLERPSAARTVLNHNLHSVYLWYTDSTFRALYDKADLVMVDGWPVWWLLHLADRQWSFKYRIGSTDWLETLMRNGRRCSRRLFVVGGDANSHEEAVRRLRAALPEWVVGGVDGYGAVAQDAETLAAAISEFAPDITLVALGMPKQEAVLHSLADRLPAAHYVTVGAAVDYVADAKPLCPRWLGRFGLEWLWRVAHEPRRLAWRYCVEPLHLGVLMLRVRLRERGDKLW